MAEVEIDDNVVFAVLLCSYVIAMEEEEEQQINNVQPHQKRVKRAARRQFWVRPWLTEGRRQQFVHFSNLLDSHLRLEDPAAFQNYTRLTPELFDEVLQRITPEIEREVTSFRKPLSPALKLAVTLRHLPTGDSYRSLAYAFRCGVSSISKMVPEVCQAIVQAYKEEVFSLAVSPEALKALAVQFEQRWNVPHAAGALDGKHIAIKKLPQTGSMYFNYKSFFSIPLLALVDACYKFVWIELGGKGHVSDAQIFGDSELFNGLEENPLELPPPCPMTSSPDDFQDMPFFILGDDVFALRIYLMKPYSRRQMSREERIYNYRISRGRRMVENAFGILANRFRCLLRTLEQKTDTVKDIVEATVVLHNLLRLRHPGIVIQEVDHEDLNHDIIPGAWRDHLDWPNVVQPNAPRNTATGDGKYHRELLKKFFSSPQGAVEWQERMAGLYDTENYI